MRKLIMFNSVTLDGYFTDARGDMSWAHAGGDDPEFAAFTQGNAQGGGVLVFGRITYEMMAGYWPTPAAAQQNAVVAGAMNKMHKIVFSRTLDGASWSNTQLIKTDPVSAIRKLKAEPGPGMAIMGSGTIVTQLAPEGLIDEYQLVICPIALGKGRTLFDGVAKPLGFKLTSSRTFKNGKIYLCYAPN